ncbi:MAG TPA: L-histidine N(alpha)-methyltransferase [Terracidiphilus sp.]|nr:L-histidine N(alpha)-methyltransferase [Terracidiphilus sp.]
MTPAASPAVLPQPGQPAQIDSHLAAAVHQGLSSRPRRLPPWLFYDDAGSDLFDRITELPEYYPTRTERSILAAHSPAILEQAAAGAPLRIVELGAGSAAKTCLLLAAAARRQPKVVYEPIDVSSGALDVAVRRLACELPAVAVTPRVLDYTNGLVFMPPQSGERRLVLYIGSSIGNFEPAEALGLLRRVRARLNPGDAILLGVDLVKDESILLAAYDDASGVTAAFNRNLLVRLNRELAAGFNPYAFVHRALWNRAHSRIEMHLESRVAQQVRIPALDLSLHFAAGETIHTENSYKYSPGQPEALLAEAGFHPEAAWTDPQNWFAVTLGRVE